MYVEWGSGDFVRGKELIFLTTHVLGQGKGAVQLGGLRVCLGCGREGVENICHIGLNR